MEPRITPRKFNIILTVSIYLAFIGAIISLYMKWVLLVWIFLILGLLFFMARNAAFIMEKVVEKRYSYDNNSGNNFHDDFGDNTDDKNQ
ncbi:MAG: hypothetical protein MIO93_06090 [ANME-2 cluster archaeon]|nr:hypothetical protein [ANME-2 cluster archaeon]